MKKMEGNKAERKKDIAIIGISGRFAQSEDINLFWKNLIAGKELIHSCKPDELRKLGVDEKLIKDPNYIFANSLIDHPENFDYSFFGYNKDEAELMDPQTRLMHEQAWLALEDAGCNPDEYKGKIGLYLSASDNINWRAHALLNPSEQVGPFMSTRLADKSFISTLVSYNLDLRGPSFYTDTACSSSLTAVHFACRSLLMKECSIALSGASSIITTEDKGYRYEEGMIFSKDGHCRVFDKDASGTFFGEGVGVVVLKRFEDAVNDKDHIYAVIRSTAVNNDGNRKVGYTAPSVNGQAECISLAHKIAGIDPESISYIETHGTATKLGDPVEIEALNKAFNFNTNHRCAIGSVKSNLGHLDAVAGIVGLIKTALALKHQQLPPSINYKDPNPDISFESGPFYVNDQLQLWERINQEPLRAGVSSFGIGGTNAHAVLEEAPAISENPSTNNEYQIFIFSAKTPTALNNYRDKLATFINEHNSLDLKSIAYTLQTGRKHFKYRGFLVANQHNIQAELASMKTTTTIANSNNKNVVFMFSGAGSQYFKMAEQLYKHESYFKKIMDEGFDLLENKTSRDFRKIMGYTEAFDADRSLINTALYMPVLFLVEHALARLLMKNGIQPSYMIGHSLGEYVAACISGVFSFEDGLTIVMKRAELSETLPAGRMIGVELSSEQIKPYLTDELSIAAVNTKSSCVISGPLNAISDFAATMKLNEIPYTELQVAVAAHSVLFDAILDDYRVAFEKIKLNPPKIPFISNLSGKEILPEEATDINYWVKHLRHTVNFLKGISCLLEKGNANYIEIGSGGVLTSFLKQHSSFNANSFGINILRHPKEVWHDQVYYLHALGKLWKQGLPVDWDAFNDQVRYNKIPVPGYAFDKTQLKVRVDAFKQITAGANLLGVGKRNLDESLFFVNWKRSTFLPEYKNNSALPYYLIFTDKASSVGNLIDKLKATASIIEVKSDDSYQEAEGLFTMDPFKQEHYERLLKKLDDKGVAIEQVIYNWNITDQDDVLRSSVPLIYLCQQLIINQAQSLKKFTFISNAAYEVLGNERIDIAKQLARNTVEMIIKNNSGILSCCLDMDTNGYDETTETAVLNDLHYNFSDTLIAYRNDHRWISFFDKIKVNTITTTHIKQQKNYIIINGTEETGHTLSAYLKNKYAANVIITGDAVHQEDSHHYLLEASKPEDFKKVITEIETVHGTIAGVIFIAKENEISDMTDLNKVIGLQNKKFLSVQNLHAVFRNKPLDFVWIPLKLSSIIHCIDENMYADAYTLLLAHVNKKETKNWTIISLDNISQKTDEYSISELFELSLNQPVKAIIVASQNPNELIKTKGKKENTAAVLPNSDGRSTNYVPAETKMELALCELWQSFLTTGAIGIEDNFFDMGGNSLKAMTMLRRIQQKYNVQIELKDFYAKPTVKLLSEEINIATLLKSQTTKKEAKILKI